MYNINMDNKIICVEFIGGFDFRERELNAHPTTFQQAINTIYASGRTINTFYDVRINDEQRFYEFNRNGKVVRIEENF